MRPPSPDPAPFASPPWIHGGPLRSKDPETTHAIKCTRVKDASGHTASTVAACFSPLSPPGDIPSKLQIWRRCGAIPSEVFKEGVI